MKTRLMVLVVAGLLTASGFAGIEWETETLEYKVTARQREIQGVFEFTNKGERPVRIVSVQTTCGCATADLPLKTYAPGEGNRVEWRMTIPGGNLVQRHIIVTTDDAEKPRHSLTIRVERPQVFQTDQRIFVWRVGDDPTAVEAEVRILGDEPVMLTGVESNRDHFAVTLETLEPGRRYRVRMQPRDTEKIVYAMITVHSDLDSDSVLPLQFFARVLRETP